MNDGTYFDLTTAILVAHQRRGDSNCMCGGLDPGDSWAAHVAWLLETVDALNRSPADRVRGVRTETLARELERRNDTSRASERVDALSEMHDLTPPERRLRDVVRCDVVAPGPWGVRCTYEADHLNMHGADLLDDDVSDEARALGAEMSWLRWSDDGYVEEDAILPDDDVHTIHHRDPGDDDDRT